MSAITSFDSADFERIGSLQYKINPELSGKMDSLLDTVVDGGGFCDEAVYVAGFFGAVGTQWGEERSAGLRHKDIPQAIRSLSYRIDNLQYSLGEPFMFDTDYQSVGIITPPKNAVHGSPVLEYQVKRSSPYSFEGFIGFQTLRILTKLAPSDQTPVAQPISALHVKRYMDHQTATVETASNLPRMHVGMVAIRKALAADSRLITEGVWESVDRSVQILRESNTAVSGHETTN